jgi:hypothetical protein
VCSSFNDLVGEREQSRGDFEAKRFSGLEIDMSDIDTVVVDSLKALDPEWPIREADIRSAQLFQPACRPKMRNCRDKQQKRGNRRDQAVNAKRVDKRDLQIGKIDRKAHTDGGIDERRQSKTTREWVVRKQCCQAQHVQVVHNPKVTYR